MIRYLVKNNFKLMLRNIWSIVIMVLAPVLIIGVLSSAFSELMKSYEGTDEFTVGYRVEEGSFIADYMETIREAGEKSGITFCEYSRGEPKDVMADHQISGFVEFTENEYVLYQSADYETEGMILEYFLDAVMREGVNASLKAMNPTTETEVVLPVSELEFMPAIDAKDYYGMIYLVYFSWCGMVCATGVLNNEKKYRIERKFQVSGLSETQMYLGKYVPVTMTVAAEIGIAAAASILLYDIHWGNPFLSAGIVCMMILAGNAFGMMIYNISDNIAITIIVLFTVVWVMGFLGGSFETYMFSSIPDTARHLSPIYYGNRALVELSCMGHSEYVSSAVGYSLAVTVVCSVIAVLAGRIRKRGRA